MTKTMTEAQRRMLLHADRCVSAGYDGVLAKGSGLKTAHALSKAGLLRYAGHGVDADGSADREWPIYELTDAGREWVSGRQRKGGRP